MKEKNRKMSRMEVILLNVLCIILISIVSFTIYETETARNTYYICQKNLQIPIFVYHDLVENSSEIEHDYMQTDVDTFEKQITGLMALGYTPISYQDLVDYKNGQKAISKWSFLITFDDGYEGVYKYAYPIAKKYNIPMTSFVINDCVGLDNYYTWEQAKEMHDSGLISIYSHGFTHIDYTTVSTQELVSQTNQAYSILETNLQDSSILKVFTYPYGSHTEEDVEALAQEGYIQNLTDNLVNESNTLDLSRLHRSYPLEENVFGILFKIEYRVIRYHNLI